MLNLSGTECKELDTFPDKVDLIEFLGKLIEGRISKDITASDSRSEDEKYWDNELDKVILCLMLTGNEKHK